MERGKERRRKDLGVQNMWRANSLPLTGQQLDFFLRWISPPHSCLEHELGDGRGSRKNSSSLPSRNCTGNRRLGMCKTGLAGTVMQGEERSHNLKDRKDH